LPTGSQEPACVHYREPESVSVGLIYLCPLCDDFHVRDLLSEQVDKLKNTIKKVYTNEK
jgi:hypothetical protein